MKKLFFILLSVALLTGCGEKKLDLTSQDTFKTSAQAIAKDLKGDDQESFKKALVKITMVSALEAQGDGDKINQILKDKLDGKTAADVIKIAENQKSPFDKTE